jgi:hypothetical protein
MQSPLAVITDSLSKLQFTGPLLPLTEYTTVITNFPGTNCFAPYGETGSFFLDLRVYSEGKQVWEYNTLHTNESGVLQIDFDHFLPRSQRNIDGIIIADFTHSKSIPMELYITHAHRKSGAYVAYPSAMFIGDEIYPEVHTSEMENTLFWPGLASSPQIQHAITILNPFHVPYHYQLALIVGQEVVARTNSTKVKPFHYRTEVIEESFLEHLAQIQAENGKASICVTGQFKILANMVIRHISSGVITTIDHLHRYGMV